jgi:DNA-binding transcriptional MerR regulator
MEKPKTILSISTPQLSGMLNLSMNTLKRYSKVYGAYLSPTASQKKRGRRWTPLDVNKVILIRRMHQNYVGEEKIINVLKDWESDPPSVSDPMSLMDEHQFVMDALSILDEVKRDKEEIKKLVNTAQWNRQDFISLERETKADIKRIYFQLDKIREFQNLIMVRLSGGKTRNPNWKKVIPILAKVNENLDGMIEKVFNQIENG